MNKKPIEHIFTKCSICKKSIIGVLEQDSEYPDNHHYIFYNQQKNKNGEYTQHNCKKTKTKQLSTPQEKTLSNILQKTLRSKSWDSTCSYTKQQHPQKTAKK